MRAFLIALALVAPAAIATHTPGTCSDDGQIRIGMVEFGANGSIFYVFDDATDVAHVYEESNGIYAPSGDIHGNLQREADHGGLHGDLPPECVDPNVVPDTHLF